MTKPNIKREEFDYAEVKPVYRDPEHVVGKVVTRNQYVYAITLAVGATETDVETLWNKHRDWFRPYDESTGHYCD